MDMDGIESNADQLQALATEADDNDNPVVMLNLLKFKKDRGYATYLRHIEKTGPFVRKVGAEVLYFGMANERLYGSETWDAVLLVKYPSRKAFLKMATDPDYLKAHEYRVHALERAVLYATDPAGYKTLQTHF